jgi:hypothetical protein
VINESFTTTFKIAGTCRRLENVLATIKKAKGVTQTICLCLSEEIKSSNKTMKQNNILKTKQNKQINKQANKQTNKQTNKTNKQTNKQTHK